jgi:hypothetical protein
VSGRPWRVWDVPRWRRRWSIWSFGIEQKHEGAALALAGIRYANSGVAQWVWNVDTGEKWSVGYNTRRLK